MMKVKLYLRESDAKVPMKKSEGAAGVDIQASSAHSILSGTRELVSTELSMVIPDEYYAQIKARSGLAVKGIDVGAGVIDSDYRGEIKVLIINNSDSTFHVKKGDRIAQLLFIPVASPMFHVYHELPEEFEESSTRGSGGFGSTGIQ